MAMQYHRSDPSEQVTPPSSFIKAPLTPPPTDPKPSKLVLKILRFVRHRQLGRNVSQLEWHTFKLRNWEYENLLTLLKNEGSLWTFVETKFRYDYNFTTETLSLRMPSLVHEVFIARVVEEIQNKLQALTDVDSRSRAFAQKIKHNGSGTLYFSGEENSDRTTSKRDPDAEFKHDDARWPGVIIEVSYSQKTKDVPHLADDYILDTNGSVRVVVGLDIDYRTKKGTISMWRPAYTPNEQGQLELEAAQTLNNQVFRDEIGGTNLSQDAGLKLDLGDFAPQDLARGIAGSFLIDATTLCRFLSEAEQVEKQAKQKRGVEQNLLPGAGKRRRGKSPPEDVNSEDEQRHADDEGLKRERQNSVINYMKQNDKVSSKRLIVLRSNCSPSTLAANALGEETTSSTLETSNMPAAQLTYGLNVESMNPIASTLSYAYSSPQIGAGYNSSANLIAPRDALMAETADLEDEEMDEDDSELVAGISTDTPYVTVTLKVESHFLSEDEVFYCFGGRETTKKNWKSSTILYEGKVMACKVYTSNKGSKYWTWSLPSAKGKEKSK